MKTSKIIFITLLSSVALLMLLAFVDVRFFGRRNDSKNSYLAVNKTPIPPFKVLCINSSSSIHIFQNDSTYIETAWPKDSILPMVNYKISNDTLTISDVDNLYRPRLYLAFRVSATDSLKSIILNKSDVTIDRFVCNRMSFEIDCSSVWFNQDKSFFYNLQISAKNKSTVNSVSFNVDTLGIQLHNSEANFGVISKKITCNLSDSSSVSLHQANELTIKKDQSSNSSVNDN